jgi:hypothetical protein
VRGNGAVSSFGGSPSVPRQGRSNCARGTAPVCGAGAAAQPASAYASGEERHLLLRLPGGRRVGGTRREWIFPRGTHLRPLRRTDVNLHIRAIMESQERLWCLDRSGWQWAAKTLTADQDRQDLARRETEMEQRIAFGYPLLTSGERGLLGCVHIEPSVELELGAGISWWVIDWLVDSPIEQALDSSVRAWIVADWPISSARYAWHPLKSGLCQDDSAQRSV